MASLSRCFIVRHVPIKQRWMIPITNKALFYSSEKKKETKKKDIYTYTEELDKLAKLGTDESACQAEQMLIELERNSKDGHSSSSSSSCRPIIPNTVTYNTVLHALAKRGEAHRAEQILRRMEHLYSTNNQRDDVQPDVVTYTTVIYAYANSTLPNKSLRAEQLFFEMSRKAEERQDPTTLTPNTRTYNTVLSAIAKSGEQPAIRAQQLLRHMMDKYRNGHNVKPNTTSFTIVMDAWARESATTNSGNYTTHEVEQLFYEMERWDDCQPNIVTYNTLLNAWAKHGEAQRAEDVLQTMLQQHPNNNTNNVKPNTISFTTVIEAWANSGDSQGPAKAEHILRQMEEKYHTKPDVWTYNAVFHAYAKSCSFRGGNDDEYSTTDVVLSRVEELLAEMEYRSIRETQLRPNTATYNAVIHVLAKGGAAQRAENVLRTMVDRYHHQKGRRIIDGKDIITPNTISFTSVIDAWANSGDSRGPSRSEQILRQMEEMYQLGNHKVQPNIVTYSTVINAYAQSGEKGSAFHAERLLAELEQRCEMEPQFTPHTVTYSTVLHALAKSGERGAAERAETVLRTMVNRYHQRGGDVQAKPNTISFTSVIDAWAKSGDSRGPSRSEQILRQMEEMYQLVGDHDLQPDIFTYNTVINSYAKSKEKGAVYSAEKMLAEMERRCELETHLKPDIITYNTVIHALAKSGERHAAERAEAILQNMVERYHNGDVTLRPNTISFNSVVNAWARSGDIRGPSRAEQILRKMEELYKLGNHDLRPNLKTFSTVIHSYAKSIGKGSVSRAEQLLAEMERRSQRESHLKPDTVTYTTVINAIAKSGERGAAVRAERILTLMQKQHEEGNNFVKPNAHTYNTVINACAFTKRHEEHTDAFAIAFRVFNQMTVKNVKPDAVTYSSLLNVCRNLLPRKDVERKFIVAKSLLEECREAGYVNDYVLKALRQTVSEEQYIQLVGSSDQNSNHLPRQWTRNIVFQKFS